MGVLLSKQAPLIFYYHNVHFHHHRVEYILERGFEATHPVTTGYGSTRMLEQIMQMTGRHRVGLHNAVSTRHLHNLFQHSGTTVTRWIWERRLKAAREDILNPVMMEKSITEIAYQRGFNDSAHFSRTFKSRFDLAPSQLRKKLLEELRS